MTAHVVVPVDGSTQSTAALSTALELFPEEPITLLYIADAIVGVDDDDSSTLDELRAEQRRAAERYFDGALATVDDDRPIETAVETGSPWRQIVEYAEENDVDHIVMGSHGRDGPARVLLGSVAELVVRRAPVPVTVVK